GAGARAFALAMAKKGPRNLTNGATIDTYSALSVYNRRQFHHIYPQDYLKTHTRKADPNNLMNICLLTASENNNISNSAPDQYLPRLIHGLGDRADSVFDSNLLPLPDTLSYNVSDYEAFLYSRGAVAAKWIERLCRG